MFGTRLSRNSTVRRRPLAFTEGCWVWAGDTTSLLAISSSLMFSLKNKSTLGRVTPVVPGAGFARTNSGGTSSRGPPSGRPIEAHAATSEAKAPAMVRRIQSAAFTLKTVLHVKRCLNRTTFKHLGFYFLEAFGASVVPRSRIELLSKV